MIKRASFIILTIIGLASNSIAEVCCKEGFADLVAPLVPAVVNISVVQKASKVREKFGFPPNSQLEEFYKFFERFGQVPGMEEDEGSDVMKPIAAGSGFIISAEGHIVTNHHVIENAEKIVVTLSNDRKLEAKLIGSDERTDLALLKVESKTPLNFVKFGNSDESRVGDLIITIGNPFGLGGTVTSGIISAQARTLNTYSTNIIDNFIQTDASINSGNSGGPMFNMKGEVIGVNFAIFSPSGGSVGVGFAVPSSAAKPIIDQLIKTGKVHHGWLGAMIQSTDDMAEGLGLKDGSGALVASVMKNSPAEKAGIQVGDIVLKFDGKEITTNTRLPRIVAETPVGKKVNVELMSNGKRKTITLVVGELGTEASKEEPVKGEKNKSLYGMGLSSITEEVRQKLRIQENVNGVFVSNVERKSLAAKYGIKRGDIISAVNQQPINKTEDLLRVIDEAKKMQRKSVMLQIHRINTVIFLNMPILD